MTTPRWVRGPHPASKAGPRHIRQHEDYVPAEGCIVCPLCPYWEDWKSKFTRITEYEDHRRREHPGPHAP